MDWRKIESLDDLQQNLRGFAQRGDEAMYQCLMEAADEIDRLRSLTTWRSIETAPKDGTWFIATYDGAGGYELMQWVTPPDGRETGLYLAGYFRPWGRAIAWLPLPTPPEIDT